jgi:hypothetical protein
MLIIAMTRIGSPIEVWPPLRIATTARPPGCGGALTIVGAAAIDGNPSRPRSSVAEGHQMDCEPSRTAYAHWQEAATTLRLPSVTAALLAAARSAESGTWCGTAT